MPFEVEEKWREYFRTKNTELRNQLAINYQGLVHYVAQGFRYEGVSVLEWKDLLSSGNVGLLEAIERFDPARKIKFETFAILRIRGAILDTLRDIDWVPRLMRKNIKKVMRALSDLQAHLKRNPGESEIAEKLGISLGDYHKVLNSMSSVRFVSMHELVSINGEADIPREKYIDSLRQDYGESVDDYNELKNLMYKKIHNLPTKERLVLILYYYEGLNLAEIAKVLNVTESRVCQLNSQALMRLRILLGKEEANIA